MFYTLNSSTSDSREPRLKPVQHVWDEREEFQQDWRLSHNTNPKMSNTRERTYHTMSFVRVCEPSVPWDATRVSSEFPGWNKRINSGVLTQVNVSLKISSIRFSSQKSSVSSFKVIRMSCRESRGVCDLNASVSGALLYSSMMGNFQKSSGWEREREWEGRGGYGWGRPNKDSARM